MNGDGTVSDEMLMAAADGELPEEDAAHIERLAEADPAVRQRLDDFRASRRAAREAYAPILDAPAPARLSPPPLTPHRSKLRAELEDSPEHRNIASWVAMAAGVVAAVGVGYWLGGAGGTATPWAPALHGALLAAVANAPSGQALNIRVGGPVTPFEALGSYPVEGGVCRVFVLGGGTPIRAVACNGGGAWELMLAAAEGSGAYGPASGGAPETVEAWLDAAGAGAALSPAAEADLIARTWEPAMN